MSDSTDLQDDERVNANMASDIHANFYQLQSTITVRRRLARNVPRGRAPFIFETTSRVAETFFDQSLNAPEVMVQYGRDEASAMKHPLTFNLPVDSTPAADTTGPASSRGGPFRPATSAPTSSPSAPFTFTATFPTTAAAPTAASTATPAAAPASSSSAPTAQASSSMNPFVQTSRSSGPFPASPNSPNAENTPETRATAVRAVFDRYKENQAGDGLDTTIALPTRFIFIDDD